MREGGILFSVFNFPLGLLYVFPSKGIDECNQFVELF